MVRPLKDSWADALAVCIGCVLMLCVYGYQYGRSNHGVYLLDGIHKADPAIFANDWYTTQTFQYHAIFGWVTATLLKLNIIQPAFLLGYIGIVVWMQWGWFRLVQQLGGDRRTYLIAVLAYLLSAGGTGLGMYQFLQDGCMLPSNIANVALLWGIVQWIRDRRISSAICFGLAGTFHLNHSVIVVGLWSVLVAWNEYLDRGSKARWMSGFGKEQPATAIENATIKAHKSTRFNRLYIASAIALLPCLINIVIAARLKFGMPNVMPLKEWLDLYVRFRHPHHYDPRTWPLALWMCFLWPLVPMALAFASVLREAEFSPLRRAWREMIKIAFVFYGLIVVALLFAGMIYVSGTLVQLSLYRFSIYPHLLACTAASWLLCQRLLTPTRQRSVMLAGSLATVLLIIILYRTAPTITGISVEGMRAIINAKVKSATLFCLLSFTPLIADFIALIPAAKLRRGFQIGAITALVAVCFAGWSRWIGLIQILDEDDRSYVKLCDWVRVNTPTDAVFLVSPGESMFRLQARRSIVVNFKSVPQLNSEMPAWRDRLKDILGIEDLLKISRGFTKVGSAMDKLYDTRMAPGLIDAARKYGANYIVTRRKLDDERLQWVPTPQDDYLLYELRR
jgi:hypothetical protein